MIVLVTVGLMLLTLAGAGWWADRADADQIRATRRQVDALGRCVERSRNDFTNREER